MMRFRQNGWLRFCRNGRSMLELVDFATDKPPVGLRSSMTGTPATVAGERAKRVRCMGHSGSPASSSG